MFICRRRNDLTERFWAEVERHPEDAPDLIRELLRDRQVYADSSEADEALSWARRHPAWLDDPVPLYVGS